MQIIRDEIRLDLTRIQFDLIFFKVKLIWSDLTQSNPIRDEIACNSTEIK
jgi:hypothetical protein